MLNRFASLVLVAALVCTLGGTSAFAKTPSQPDDKSKEVEAPPDSDATTKKEGQPNERLKADMVKLVAEAKAGKVKPTAQPQIQPAKSNNLSKGTKIAIGVGVAVAVVAVIVIVRLKNESFFH
jgi:hypothetical protein